MVDHKPTDGSTMLPWITLHHETRPTGYPNIKASLRFHDGLVGPSIATAEGWAQKCAHLCAHLKENRSKTMAVVGPEGLEPPTKAL